MESTITTISLFLFILCLIIIALQKVQSNKSKPVRTTAAQQRFIESYSSEKNEVQQLFEPTNIIQAEIPPEDDSFSDWLNTPNGYSWLTSTENGTFWLKSPEGQGWLDSECQHEQLQNS